ncbi:LysR family transcriptional regulator [Pontivivens insulae]|uniref:HTH-type transcriptional regulator GltC n=1 Tax=Pontivivens insulae TaxID=1639689 RepID=A0A2R8ABY8_9RHOB|nr:LysR family transcriptional regulator [Pontivivens insulae]RED11062.1 LysR family transcriptional regulator [Pontivivens insulae]SPF29763.1 HTH-type transcriptional regulator GltC [Pontivivens insulae]
MPRNLDMTALRSFVTVAECGGVTRAAGQLHLTQSAVSMQIKRLEESLGQPLLDRSGRGVALSAQGEQLLGYGRRILRLNDEVWSRMTHSDYEGEIVFGVPHDIVYPHVPLILQRFAVDYPRVKVTLISSYTRGLKAQMARGEVDLILTTEQDVDAGGVTLASKQLEWVGAPNGQAWKQRPLRLAFEYACIFRAGVQVALDSADVPWEMAVESDSTRTVEASVSADLAVHAVVSGSTPPYMEAVRHGGALPQLPEININMYVAKGANAELAGHLARAVRGAYGGPTAVAAE